MSFSTRLLSVLSNLGQSFHPNELAFLAATSKVEGPVRDRIAYYLHVALAPGVLVHREWRGRNNLWADIAVTDEQNRPKYLLELKAHSAPTFEPGYSDLTRNDLQKLFDAGDEETELYVIFLFNHIYHPGNIDPKFAYTIKYFGLQNNASHKNGFAIDVSVHIKAHWERHLAKIGLPVETAHQGIRIDAGQFYGMPVTVHAYVLGPLVRKELEGMFDKNVD
ncbi:MAG TPA: hypothetical protein VHE34_26055 [Puia sp.]|uniref:hypothetical protein n=1 Tax=Puia sp. TaxID=2045100 RepID=UPI002CA8F957|nr:hypothetical protein [Puia sp.]HVU98724.1 hypothetical protein [Puia sp.]